MATLSLEFMLEYRTSFIDVLSQHYPIPTEWLSRYADVWDWARLSQNTALAWDEALLDEHVDQWSWPDDYCFLSSNTALPWSVNLIRKYVALDKLEWLDLAEQPKVFESAEMLELCLPHWNAAAAPPDQDDGIASAYRLFQSMPWGADADQWAPSVVAASPGFRWDLFSAVENFPWSSEFIEAHADKLDWRRLSVNPGLPWSVDFIRKFEDRYIWDDLSGNEEIPWTEAGLDRFAEKVSWARPSFVWGKWDGKVQGLLNNPHIRWTPSLFARQRSNVEAQFRRLAEEERTAAVSARYWTYYCDTNNWTPDFVELMLEMERTGEIDRPTIDWEHLCQCASDIWTPDFIDAHRERLDWVALASNPSFPWTERIDDFADQLSKEAWKKLSENENFGPSPSTLTRYADRWDWALLSQQQVSFADAETELPWDWEALIHNAAPELCAQIDDATVEDFLVALGKDRRQIPARNLELESVIARDLEQRDNYEVYADWLSERGDPHAHLIRSMFDPSEPFDVGEFGTREWPSSRDPGTRARSYERFLEMDGRSVLWHRGFVRAAWQQSDDDWRRLVSLRAFRFIEVLQCGEIDGKPIDDIALELLRPLDCLTKLAIYNSQIQRPDALAHLGRLTDLHLSGARLTDLSPLAALQQLQCLRIRNTHVEDLSPIAELPNLRTLDVGQGPLHDISPLRACRSLVALDLCGTAVRELSPLHELTALRRIFVERATVDEVQIHALREALPALEFCNYAEFWPRVGRVGPFVRLSDC